jgi:hypothetical protein
VAIDRGYRWSRVYGTFVAKFAARSGTDGAAVNDERNVHVAPPAVIRVAATELFESALAKSSLTPRENPSGINSWRIRLHFHQYLEVSLPNVQVYRY